LAQVEDLLERSLARQNVRVSRQNRASGDLRITLSESRRGLSLVAELLRGTERKVLIVPMKELAPASESSPQIKLSLDSSLLWEQEKRILDIALVESRMLVLDSEGVGLLQKNDGRWEKLRSVPAASHRGWPRDLRGRLESKPDEFSAYLPGLVCHGRLTPEFQMDCEESQSEWPLQTTPEAKLTARFEAGRNHFSLLATETETFFRSSTLFSSAAFLQGAAEPLWVLAHDEGVRVYDRASLAGMTSDQGTPSASDQRVDSSYLITTWGSDVVALRSPCAPAGLLLATGGGDDPREDFLQAFEFVNRQPTALSAPAVFPGTLTALWPTVTSAAATAVVRKPANGHYAAYRVAVACDR
jgi:hypothetical protein